MGDYELKKVIIEQEITFTKNDAQQNYNYFLAGANIRLDQNKVLFNPVDLPLYVFDRKAYWHDVKETKETITPENWCFELEWQYQPIDKNHLKKLDKHWLLIGAQQGDLGLREQGLNIIQEQDNYSFNDLDGIIFAVDFETSSPKDIDWHIDRQKNTLKKLLALVKELHDNAIELRLIILTTEYRSRT